MTNDVEFETAGGDGGPEPRACKRPDCPNTFVPAKTGRAREYCSARCRRMMWSTREDIRTGCEADGQHGEEEREPAGGDLTAELVDTVARLTRLTGELHREREELDPASVRAKVARAVADAASATAEQRALRVSLQAAAEAADEAERAQADAERRADEEATAAAAAIAQHDQARELAEGRATVAEDRADRAGREKTAALVERDTAVQQRDAAQTAQRAAADARRIAEEARDQAKEQAAAAFARREAAEGERDRMKEERDAFGEAAARADRDRQAAEQARREAETAAAEASRVRRLAEEDRDRAQVDRDRLAGELTENRALMADQAHALQLVTAERDRLRDHAAAETARANMAAAELDRERTRADRAEGQAATAQSRVAELVDELAAANRKAEDEAHARELTDRDRDRAREQAAEAVRRAETAEAERAQERERVEELHRQLTQLQQAAGGIPARAPAEVSAAEAELLAAAAPFLAAGGGVSDAVRDALQLLRQAVATDNAVTLPGARTYVAELAERRIRYPDTEPGHRLKAAIKAYAIEQGQHDGEADGDHDSTP